MKSLLLMMILINVSRPYKKKIGKYSRQSKLIPYLDCIDIMWRLYKIEYMIIPTGSLV